MLVNRNGLCCARARVTPRVSPLCRHAIYFFRLFRGLVCASVSLSAKKTYTHTKKLNRDRAYASCQWPQCGSVTHTRTHIHSYDRVTATTAAYSIPNEKERARSSRVHTRTHHTTQLVCYTTAFVPWPKQTRAACSEHNSTKPQYRAPKKPLNNIMQTHSAANASGCRSIASSAHPGFTCFPVVLDGSVQARGAPT